MQQPVMAAAPRLSLLDLPPDLLIRIGVQLPFAERLRLSLVCRHWRQVCGGPSALWGCVEARIDVPDETSEPEDSEHELELETLVLTAAQDKVTAFRECVSMGCGVVQCLLCAAAVWRSTAQCGEAQRSADSWYPPPCCRHQPTCATIALPAHSCCGPCCAGG